MAKKIVRGITDVKTITNQDFDTNNVNDLLSDGQYSYIHRKKGKSEEYHNLTDNIKTISSDNTDLLAVTNNNKTTNSATLHPKHDAQKEQVLESTRNTVTIQHGTNGTDEKTTVDTNPQKVLEHSNLISNSQYVTIEHEEDSNTSEIKTDKLNNTINELNSKIATVDGKIPTIIGGRNYLRGTSNQYKTYTSDNYILGHPTSGSTWDTMLSPLKGKTVTIRAYIKNDTDYPVRIEMWFNNGGVYGNFIPAHEEGWSVGTGKVSTDWTDANVALTQPSLTAPGGTIQAKEVKLEIGSIPTDWTPAPEDIYPLLAQKQDTIQSNVSIGVSGNGLRQLYTLKQSYTHDNGVLKTHVKSVSQNTSVNTPEEEFNFILKINQGSQEATFTLNEHDKTKFNNIITAYGVGNAVRINGCLFTLSNSTLTVTTDANTGSNHVITFSDII